MKHHVLEIIKDELIGKIRARCPKCDKVIWTWENKEPKKCERCGQELKWNEKVLNTQYGKTKGNDMAKILVDELPEIPEQCPFDTTVMVKYKPEWCDREIEIPVDVCILSRENCEHTEECEYLKVR